jgi:hypothetical protein
MSWWHAEAIPEDDGDKNMEQETEETWPDLAEAALSLLFSSLLSLFIKLSVSEAFSHPLLVHHAQIFGTSTFNFEVGAGAKRFNVLKCFSPRFSLSPFLSIV